MKSLFSLFVLFSAILSAETIYPQSYIIGAGEVGDQKISVLSTQDQFAKQNNWNAYQELIALDNKSIVQYKFKASQNARTCTRAVVTINSMGEPKLYEKWNLYIKNEKQSAFEFMMRNGDQDWRWEVQSKTLKNPAQYMTAKGIMTLRINCNGACSVRDIDYMAIAFEGCKATSPTPNPTPTSGFVVGSTYNLQFSQTQNLTTDGFSVMDIDMEDTSATKITSLKNQGKSVICYISAGSYENWRSDADQFTPEVLGLNISGWVGEKWLDISNLNVLKPIMAARMDRAKAKGCDAIDSDNIDGYNNNTGFDLTYQDQITYNTMLATLAHERGLKIGLKNDVAQISDLVNSFDFAINESCYIYDECDGYTQFIAKNKPVYIIEYDADVYNAYLSDAMAKKFYMIHKNRDLGSFVEAK